MRGELTLEAYPASNTVPQDYRLNVGPLQIRALGADLWTYANGEGEAVCLHQGAIEITGNAGEQRLDMPGQCLQHRTGGALQVLAGAETELKDRLLTAEMSAVDTVIAAQTPIDDAPAASTKAATATTLKPADNTPHWVVVVATARNRATAESTAYKLRKRTLRVTVRETGKAPTPFSVTFGDFLTRKEANEFSQKLQRKYRLKVVRVAALS